MTSIGFQLECPRDSGFSVCGLFADFSGFPFRTLPPLESRVYEKFSIDFHSVPIGEWRFRIACLPEDALCSPAKIEIREKPRDPRLLDRFPDRDGGEAADLDEKLPFRESKSNFDLDRLRFFPFCQIHFMAFRKMRVTERGATYRVKNSQIG